MTVVLPFRLDRRRALITGGSRGIGRAIALALAGAGADVAIHYLDRANEAQAVATTARAFGVRASIVVGDLARPAMGRQIVEAARTDLGGIDILVVNASVESREDWMSRDERRFEEQIRINLDASLDLAAAAVSDMATRRWGRVVFVGSIQGRRPNPRMVVYAALKSALANIAINLARQLASSGITVNTISPGAIATERNAAVLADNAYRDRVIGMIPMGRIGSPEDCAGAVGFLCSAEAGYITGADIPIDGGWHIG